MDWVQDTRKLCSEYTDGTFRVQRPRTGSEEHLGILGKGSQILLLVSRSL